MFMARTIRAERPWFEDSRRWAAEDEAEGRPLTPHAERFHRRPLTADGRFSDASQHGPERNRRARRAFKAGNDARARFILKEW